MITKLFSPSVDHLISTELLDFDLDNPRFTSLRNNEPDDVFDPFETICNVYGVRNLVASIVSGGYHEAEPMLVMPTDGRYIVLDGNRRLAAIRVIRDRDIHAHHYPQWLGEPSAESLESIMEVPVIAVRDRKEVWPLLARRHVTGMMKWDNYGKASFFQHVSDRYTVPDYQLANYLGVEKRELCDFLAPNKLIIAAEQAGTWDQRQMEGKRIVYSRVARALLDGRIQRFVGISRLGDDGPAVLNVENAGRLLAWLLGNKERGIRPVLKDTDADIRKLGRVVECDEAMQYLDEHGWLEHAYQLAVQQKFPINDDLYAVHNKLWEMLASLPDYEVPHEAEGLAKQVKRVADDLYERVVKKNCKRY